MDRIVRFWDGNRFALGLLTDKGQGRVWDRIIIITANGLTVARLRADEDWELPQTFAASIDSFKRIAQDVGATVEAAELMGLEAFKTYRESKSEDSDEV